MTDHHYDGGYADRGGFRTSLLTGECTRRTAITIGLTQMLCAMPLLAAPANFDWQPANLPPDTNVSFTDRQGRVLTLAAFAGRPLLLNIWATWCAPCVIELPALDRFQRDLKGRIAVAAISVDHSGMGTVIRALRRLSLRHLAAYVDMDGQLVSRLKLVGLPATVAISARGDFLYVRRGRVDWDDPEERKRIEALLKA